MAGPKIVWSGRARIRWYEILQFYIDRNKSKAFSVKLNGRLQEELRLLRKYPDLGIKTDIPGIRGLIFDSFILFYEAEEKTIYIHYIWDSRQDPEKLTIK